MSIRRTSYQVVDGDTIYINRGINGRHYIRLSGINTPEKRERGYVQGKHDLASVLAGRPITIKPQAVNQNRIVGTVKVHGKNVNRQMRRWGWF